MTTCIIKVISFVRYMKQHLLRNNLNVTLPPEILNRIEEGVTKAKDMTKSRFVLRLLEKVLNYRGRRLQIEQTQ